MNEDSTWTFVFMGDPPEMGDVPTASSLSDVTSSELIKIVSGMNRGLGLSGNKLDDPTFFTVGCAINLEPEDIESEIESLKRKIEPGDIFTKCCRKVCEYYGRLPNTACSWCVTFKKL